MAAVDEFSGYAPGAGDCANRVFVITPNDSQDLAFVTRAIRATAAGKVRLIPLAGGAPVDCDFAASETRPIRAVKVFATGTTATGLEGMS